MRLNVRREQIDVMAAVSEANFERAIARDLLSNYGDAIVRLPEGGEYTVADLPEETLERLVRVGIDKARRFEVTRQSSIAGFVAMMFSSAPNFDTNRLCEVLLSDEEKTPDDRADEIPNVLSEKNWDAIRNDYDPQAWILPEVAPPETASPEGSGADETEQAADPMAKTVTGKTLARIAKKPKETVDLQPQVPAGEPGVDVNTVKIDREK
jgi:hypothetical protein